MNTEIYVFADWEVFPEPVLVGTLRASVSKTREHFSFSYDQAWLSSPILLGQGYFRDSLHTNPDIHDISN
jgi:hypothetical protein